MAFNKILLLLAVVTIVFCDKYGFKEKDKKKAVEMENEQKSRSTVPERGSFRKLTNEQKSRSAVPERGSFRKLTKLLNNTEERRNRSRDKFKINQLNQIAMMDSGIPTHNLMSEDEEAIAIKERVHAGNDTNSLKNKLNELRHEGPFYEAGGKVNYIPPIRGVYCNFENTTNSSFAVDMCMWEWNTTVSSHGLGFRVVTPAEVFAMNKTTRGLKFAAPMLDADSNPEGHFLYLPVDPTMENMVIKSPPFPGLWEYCKFEARMHQSKMQNASIKLLSEATTSNVQVILQEVAGDNFEIWRSMRFMIGKMQQEVRILIEITRPSYVSVAQTLPHIAIDNIRMVECLPEPPVFNGECKHGQLKCFIMNKESCIQFHRVCDLVKDCDDGSDEDQNCEKMPYGSYCNFEQDNCGFEDVPRTILKWSRHSGPTPTAKTGPNNDHTCGPPDPNPTVIIPPLIPAHMNYTISHCVGYYFYVNMNVTGPNNETPDFGSTAVMKTVIFNPPPKVHGSITSKYYNCCMIRFYYQQNGRNYGSLSLEVVELTNRGNHVTSLWFSTKDKGENWYRANIFLPNVTRRYYLQFKTGRGMRMYSDSAIDDFSMAPECFGLNIDPEELGDYNYYNPVFVENTKPHPDFADKIYYRFTTCGATGPQGPNETMCEQAYNGTSVSVEMMKRYPGVQVWEVPGEGLYTIIAVGGSGGLGSMWAGASLGASVRGLFVLHRGERLHMLVGQQGLNACKKTLSAQEIQDCSRDKYNETNLYFTSKTHEVRNTHVQDGGGGGGGATFVFLVDKDGQPRPLIIAGGGGGISVGTFKDDGSQHAKPYTNATAESGYMYGQPGKTSGAGGGWESRSGPITPGFESVRGTALREGGAGGLACWGGAHGGFGGGGGGCLRGGGGGGWHGGNTHEGSGLHGGGGWSWLDTTRAERDYTEVALASRAGPGEVIIIPAIHDCGCDYRCVALNEYRSEVRCYCAGAWITDHTNQTKCVLENPWGWPYSSRVTVGVMGFVLFMVSMAAILFCLFLYNKYQKRKEEDLRRKRIHEQDLQLHSMHTVPVGNDNHLSMAFNIFYGSESILAPGINVRGLPQVSRESLKLVKALGQGAFGEVYQGLYRHRVGDTVEMPVAVKTLPELSTEQAELEFLMEAGIMANFSHANIVHLIGVCFDRHPRFIVLELLAGGDLKNFLRESRPKPERASALSMSELIACVYDVCKGCRYLETKHFIHRDIAARNCLLTSRGPGRVVKIADFGMARDIYRSDYYKKGGKAMLPIKWMPPEAYIDGEFSPKTDVWSFGVLLWEVFSLGVMPYTGCSNREVMELVSGGGRLEKPSGCPQEVYRLMCECWNPTPEDRPSFAQMQDRIQIFLQDPEITSAPLPVVRFLNFVSQETPPHNGPQHSMAGDYLVPKSPKDSMPDSSSMDPLVPHSKSPTAAQDMQEMEDSPYQPPQKASQDYGNIQISSRGARAVGALGASGAETRTNSKFLPSNSTDRLLSSVEATSVDDELPSVRTDEVIRETSFTEMRPKTNSVASTTITENGPVIEKLISITPTSPKPPENELTMAVEAKVIDKTNHKSNSLIPETKVAPIASPDPPRINSWNKDAPKLNPKPKPLCLDAAQLEQNLNALKKKSGSVNLTTMNIVPSYINVVTPNKLSESKTIQIDPKKAVIHDLQSPKEIEPKEEKTKLKQSNSASSLLNGPMTDVPYADSDNTSSGSSNNTQTKTNNQKNKNYTEINIGNDRSKILKQGSNGEHVGDSEISC